jgi:hypothetical protein
MTQYSEQEISALLDELLDAYIDALNEREDRNAYWETHVTPQPPALFEDATSLADYHRRKVEQEQRNEAASSLSKAADKRFAEVSERVKEILPPGAAVSHRYRSVLSDQAIRWCIANVHERIEVQRIVP